MLNKNLVVTGGLGFIGKNYINSVKDIYEKIIVIDKGSPYSDFGFFESIKQKNINLYEINIREISALKTELPKSFDLINFAAESHVDRSFKNSINFSESNYLDTHHALEFLRTSSFDFRILHISTDEVYGSSNSIAINESHSMSPTNPYSVSKAGADLLMQAYMLCYKMPILIVRPNNIYGPYQNSEKLIPGVIKSIYEGKKFGLQGRGVVKRSFLNVLDFVNAINILFEEDWNNLDEKIYNVTSSNEFTVREIITKISEIMKVKVEDIINLVPDRPFNDTRYLTSCERLHRLGWKEKINFDEALRDIVINKQIF